MGVASLESLPKRRLPEIAFLGPSNVGKSTLVNSLLGRRQLARVSKTPGRTQQLNFFRVNDVVDFVDLPGYGFAKVPKAIQDGFRKLIEGYLSSSRHLRLLVLLQDSRRTPSERDLELRQWLLDNGVLHVIVMTKADKLSRSQLGAQVAAVRAAFARQGTAPDLLAFSATTGIGRQELWSAIEAAARAPAAAPEARPTGSDSRTISLD